MKKIIFSILFVCALAVFAGQLKAQVIVVIANKNVTEESLNKDQLFKVLTQEETYWSNDSQIKLADYSGGGIQGAFFGKLGKDAGFFEKIWTQNKFKGSAEPPVKKGSEGEVISYVSSTPGAIGYVSLASAMNADVKILMQF